MFANINACRFQFKVSLEIKAAGVAETTSMLVRADIQRLSKTVLSSEKLPIL
jgi:hypothetical protein